MEKVELRTADIAAENAAKLAELFPDIVTEVLDEDGSVRHSIDVEALKAHVGDVAEDKRERYQFTWPGKQKARAEAIRPIDKTMRPCPEESVNWDTTENLYIEGDNLDALKILRETYAGKIKMIYIDPPYNTGHDFVYNDDFARSAEEERAESGAFDDEGNVLDAAYKVNNESNGKFHSDWCSMMYPRLVLARDLLSEDGALFISIDDNEIVDLRKLCDEIFGGEGFQAQITWRRKRGKDNSTTGFSRLHEYALVYSKAFNYSPHRLPMGAERAEKYANPDNDPKGAYVLQPAWASGMKKGPSYSINLGGQLFPERMWLYKQETLLSAYYDGRLAIKGQHRDGAPNVYLKVYLSESKGIIPDTIWSDAGNTGDAASEIKDLFDGELPFGTPKPLRYVERMVRIASDNSDSVVLDFFSGSASTAHAVMQLNAEDGGRRKFIMVQLPEVCDEKSEAAKAGYKNICEIGKERIRRAGAKIASEVEESNAQLKLGEEPKRVPDIGFRVLKIDSSNFEDVSRAPDTLLQDALFSLADNVKPGRTPGDILFQLFPKLEIPYTAHIDTFDICGKTVYSVDDDTLVACFDREVPEDVVRAMAEREPAWAVLRDSSFTGDDALANFEEIFKTVSPETKTRVV